MLKIVFSSLIVFLSAVQTWRDWKAHDRRTTKHRIITVIIVLLTIASAIAMGVISYQDDLQIKELNTKLDSIKNQNDHLLDQNKELLTEVKKYKSENQELKLQVSGFMESQERDSFGSHVLPHGGMMHFNPDSTAAIERQFLRATEAVGRGSFLEAQSILNILLEKRPTHWQSLYLLGLTNLYLGDVQKAKELLKKAYSLSFMEDIDNLLNALEKDPNFRPQKVNLFLNNLYDESVLIPDLKADSDPDNNK